MNDTKHTIRSASDVEDVYPMSPLQQGMLFHSLRAPASGVDIEQLVCDLHETLDLTALQASWQRLIARHPVLRTNFRWQGLNEPRQEVHSAVELPWTEQDWRDLPLNERENRSAAFLIADRSRGFDMTEPPLLRLTLLRWDDAHSRLIWTFHHALLDGRSFAPLLREVFTFYEAFRRGEEITLPLPRPYRDYIDWLQQQDFSKAEPFWRQTLKGFSAATPLVVDQIPGLGTDHGARQGDQEVWLSTETTARLRSLALENQLTLNTVVQGAWALLLSRYSGEADVVFGATRSGRRSSLEGADAMVGLVINTLPLRVRVNPEAPLIPWLKELRVQWMAMREYEHTPLAEVQGWSEVPTGSSLFQTIVVFDNFHLDTLLRTQGGAWSNRRFRLVEKTNYLITLEVYAEAELCLKIGFDRSEFDDGTVGRLLGHLQTLLEAMATQPQQRLSQLPILTSAESYQLLVEWNDTATDYPRDKCINELFEAQVQRTPEADAVVFENHRVTYQQLNVRANQLAHQLRKLGVGPDVLVCLCVERSLEMVIGVLGILKAGGAYVPLDPSYPNERLALMLADTTAPVLVTQQSVMSRLPEHQMRMVFVDSDWEQLALESPEDPAPVASPQNLAYVLYTSGSTGRPKGVAMSHGPLSNLISWQARNVRPNSGSRTLQFASLNFDVSFQEIFSTLCVGDALVVVSHGLRLDPLALLRYLKEESVHKLFLPFVALQQMAETAQAHGVVPDSLREVITAGEQLRISPQIVWLFETLGDCRLYNQYGPTESHVVTAYALSGSPKEWPSLPPIGRPIANAQIYLLNGSLQPVPLGVTGELYIGGDVLARGYQNRADLTAERFIQSPFGSKPGARLYRTGDVARYLPDGNIEFLGRNDDQVKIRGYRVELGEIETALLSHPFLSQAAVTAHDRAGAGKRLVGYVVRRLGLGDQELGAADPLALVHELPKWLKSKLPDYMIPTAFVVMDKLPVTASGKVDRKGLPAPDEHRPELEPTYVAPRTPMEEVLASIFCDVLGLKQVGVHDNFFDLGGHSLLVVKLQARVEKELGRRVPLAAFFQAPTVGELANLIMDPSAPSHGLYMTGPRASRDKPPLFCLHSLTSAQGLGEHLESSWPVYGIESPFDEELRLWHDRHEVSISIEELAARYLPIIRGVQPRGPYYLTGFCFGGAVAFEVASQLRSQGETIALLALLDSFYLPGCKPLAMPWMRRLIHHAKQTSVQGTGYLSKKIRKRLQVSKRRRSTLKAMRSDYLAADDVEMERLRLPQAAFLMRLLASYRGKPYAGDALLFRTIEERSFTFDGGKTNGWGELIMGELQLEEFNCAHMDLPTEPHLSDVARRLKHYLAKVAVDGSSSEP